MELITKQYIVDENICKMPETESIVINTGPLLALIAGYGDLSLM